MGEAALASQPEHVSRDVGQLLPELLEEVFYASQRALVLHSELVQHGLVGKHRRVGFRDDLLDGLCVSQSAPLLCIFGLAAFYGLVPVHAGFDQSLSGKIDHVTEAFRVELGDKMHRLMHACLKDRIACRVQIYDHAVCASEAHAVDIHIVAHSDGQTVIVRNRVQHPDLRVLDRCELLFPLRADPKTHALPLLKVALIDGQALILAEPPRVFAGQHIASDSVLKDFFGLLRVGGLLEPVEYDILSLSGFLRRQETRLSGFKRCSVLSDLRGLSGLRLSGLRLCGLCGLRSLSSLCDLCLYGLRSLSSLSGLCGLHGLGGLGVLSPRRSFLPPRPFQLSLLGLYCALGFSHFSLRLGNLALRVCVGVVNGLLALLLLPGFFLGVGLLFSTDLRHQRRAESA